MATRTMIDPLAAFLESNLESRGQHPVPLASTKFEVDIEAGLALVKTSRLFRNTEKESIEATITFPVPVHAVMFSLEAKIDGRVLKARAQAKAKARETYEDALERGKSSVLHEEVLRGIHMLSVGHVPPGAEIEVTYLWSMPLTVVGARGTLRIPLTAGHVYGRSGLPDSDELIVGGENQIADLVVRSPDGPVELVGASLADGKARVPLNRPVDLSIPLWTLRDLRGIAGDGRSVTLRIEPQPPVDAPLDVAILVDHSGSMDERVGSKGNVSKHAAVVRGLRGLEASLTENDSVDLWEFDNSPKRVGAVGPFVIIDRIPRNARGPFDALLSDLSKPSGGTEVGTAIDTVLMQSSVKDILLITDGQSHALDVHTLAQSGRRFVVVLVGAGSLEANVGHLAALSGGAIFPSSGSDLTEIMTSALDVLRRPHEQVQRVEGVPKSIRSVRGHVAISAVWKDEKPESETTPIARAVAAIAAGMAMPAINSETAAKFAEIEGLVTHLTSLVLVDEAAEAQSGLPATRKVALPAPVGYRFREPRALLQKSAVSESFLASESRFFDVGATPFDGLRRSGRATPENYDEQLDIFADAPQGRSERLIGIDIIASEIDWSHAPNALLNGDLSFIDQQHAQAIGQIASSPEVVALAYRLGIATILLAIGLLARSRSVNDRSAARIAKSLLGKFDNVAIEDVLEKLRYWRPVP